MSKEHAPKLDFWVLTHQTNVYQSLVTRLSKSPREIKYLLEQELTTLDFLKEELKELQSDIRTRERYLQDKLDSEV